MSTDNFAEVIGQEQVKKTLNFFIKSYQKSSVIDPLLFVAPKGVGKTLFCHKVGAALRKNMKEIHGGTIKSKDQFISQILMDASKEKKGVTLFIDELHAIPHKVSELFLTLFNGINNDRGILNYDDMEIVIDFKKVSFLFATTERDKIFSPLLDRLSIITFDDYSYNEVSQIIQVNSGIKVCDTVLNQLASYCRGNARSAQRMGRHITKYAEVMETSKFGVKDILSLVDTLSLFPLGLNQQEFNILKTVSEYRIKGITLTNLCSMTGFDAKPQQSMEKYLLKHGLMEIEGRRKITAKGIKYLEEYYNGK